MLVDLSPTREGAYGQKRPYVKRTRRPREEWIPISVPSIIDLETFHQLWEEVSTRLQDPDLVLEAYREYRIHRMDAEEAGSGEQAQKLATQIRSANTELRRLVGAYQSDSRISLTAGVSRSIARLLAASSRNVSSGDPRAIHSALRPSKAPWAFSAGLKSGICVFSESETTRRTTMGTRAR